MDSDIKFNKDESRLEEYIGYSFKDKHFLHTALIHSSAVSEENPVSNQRLEFLGDAVLQLCISTDIYKIHHDDNEGALSKLRSLIVCADSLSITSKKIHLNNFVILGKGEENSGGRNKKNILADALESLIAAIYLDGGFAAAEKFVRENHGDIVSLALSGKLTYDYKTMLQEYVQSNKLGELSYELIDMSGPEHDRTFTTRALIGGVSYPQASAHNKKQSEHKAAENALNILKTQG